jgi:SAM-dependent methyltransferase
MASEGEARCPASWGLGGQRNALAQLRSRGMEGELRHPLFARFLDRFIRVMERDLGPLRDRLTDGLSGRVLELGAGNGINFAHYPPSVDEVVAIEPEPYLRAKAEQAAAEAPVRVTVRSGVAGALALESGSSDAAVCSLVLCSVPDPRVALDELREALRPGAQLRFLEHVRGGGSVKVHIQRGADRSRIWPTLVGGCHCSRDTVASIRAAGFEIQRVESMSLGPSCLITNPHVVGVARRS